MKTIIGINNLTAVNQLAYSNHMQFFYRLGRNTKDTFILFNPARMSIDNMRNTCAKLAMEYECDYLMFIDDDVLVPLDNKITVYEKLIAHNKEVIAGVTLVRSYPFRPMIFDWESKDSRFHFMDYEEHINDEGLVECDAVGFSCVLIKVSLLKKLNPPFFITGPNHTEDIYFCHKVRRKYPDFKFYVDPTIRTSHILGADIISPNNLEARLEYEEKLNSDLKRIEDKYSDRGKEYAELCEKMMKK